MIEGEVTDGAVVQRFAAMPDAIRARVFEAMGKVIFKLSDRVVKQKLTNQVLRRVTGTLARSVAGSSRVYEVDSQNIVGTLGLANLTGPGGRAPVKYGRAHELGFSGEVSVKQHLRTVKQVWGRALREPREVLVRPHSRKVNLPQRSFLRSALRDMAAEGEIDRYLTAAAEQGAKDAAR